jgi:DNA polymerase-3 subunit epsilon
MGRQAASIRLGDSRRRYGLPAYQGHHALRDAIATAELFQAQVAWRFSRQTPLGRLWY